jgi:hypothetical protein
MTAAPFLVFSSSDGIGVALDHKGQPFAGVGLTLRGSQRRTWRRGLGGHVDSGGRPATATDFIFVVFGVSQNIHQRQGGQSHASFESKNVSATCAVSEASVSSGREFAVQQCPLGGTRHPSHISERGVLDRQNLFSVKELRQNKLPES